MLTLTAAKRLDGRQSASHVVRAQPAAPQAFSDTLDMMGAPMSLGRNQEIYGDGELADYLYTVVSGAVRTYKVLDDGRRQNTAFYLPSDIFGLEFGDEHESSAEPVANATIRVFKRSAILALATRDGEVARQLWEMTACELHRAQDHMMLLIKSAQERVVSFLLEMAIRTSSTNEVELPMSRLDIADYLGLTIETVSRTLTQLENGGVITVQTSRHIVLRNRSALNNLSS